MCRFSGLEEQETWKASMQTGWDQETVKRGATFRDRSLKDSDFRVGHTHIGKVSEEL